MGTHSTVRIVGRTRARAQAMQLLFQAEACRRSVDDIIDGGDYAIEEGPLDEYAEQLARGTGGLLPEIDRALDERSQGWAVRRMPAVDRNLLRVATYEMTAVPDVALAVTIDEAVELAKAYSTDESPRFVNGLLGRIADDLEAGVDVLGAAEVGDEPAAADMPDAVVDGDEPAEVDMLDAVEDGDELAGEA